MPVHLIVIAACIFVFGLVWHDQPAILNKPNNDHERRTKP